MVVYIKKKKTIICNAINISLSPLNKLHKIKYIVFPYYFCCVAYICFK